MELAYAAAAGMGLFTASSLVTGVRLLALARRTRAMPELAIGVALLAGGGLAFPILVLASRALPQAPRIGILGLTVGTFLSHLGAASLALAVRHLFRPESGWARALHLSLTAVLAGAIAARVFEPERVPSPGYVFWPGMLASLACYAWSAAESFARARRLQRQAAAGETAARARGYVMWGVAATAACGIFAGVIVGRAIDPLGFPDGIVIVQAALGVVAATGILLAFLPLGAEPALAPLGASSKGA